MSQPNSQPSQKSTPKSYCYSSDWTTSGSRTPLLAYPLIFVIYLYRFTLGPLLSGNCRYDPTCSEYAEQALRRYGAWRGSIMAVRRVLRCHPWHAGGYNPVPETDLNQKTMITD
ncbi:MAG: membrane protein insertion efficiency factor YidD [bacterium]